jgi:hypothetical protein
MATTIGGAQSPKTSSIDIPDTTGAGTTEATTPQPAPADTQGDARQAEASKQLAKDNKPQMDARAGYIQQQLDQAYKNSMPKAPDPNKFVPKDADKKSDLPEQKPQYTFDASHHFVYADKDGGSGSGGPQNTPAPKTTGVNAKQSTGAKPPQTFDIMTVTPQQIKELRDKKQNQLADTIENSKAAYTDFVKANPGVKVIVTTSEGNGGKPVLVAKGAKADKDAHVHTHYHGDNATVGDPLGSKAGQNARIRDTLLKDPHAVFVLPEAANSSDSGPKPDSPSNDKRYSVSWSNVKNQVKTTNDALDAAGVQRPPKESVVSFHSGGGMALVNLVNNNKDKGSSTLQADRLELYDCVYHFGEKDGKILPAYHFEARLRDWSQTTSGQAVKQVIFYRGSNNVSRAAVMEQSVGMAKFKMIDMAKEPPLPKNPGFNPDPHYRTVGEFMGKPPRP